MSLGYVSLDRPGVTIRNFTLAGTGAKTIVTIKIEVTDPHELGWLLDELARAQKDCATRRAAEATQAKAEKARTKARPAAISRQVPLRLTYDGDRS